MSSAGISAAAFGGSSAIEVQALSEPVVIEKDDVEAAETRGVIAIDSQVMAHARTWAVAV